MGLLRTFAPTIWFLTFLLMIEDTFLRVLSREFPFNFNAEQEAVARELGRFIMTPNDDSAFILRGYAGTGKTTLIASLVKVMRKLNRQVVLMAPTGRAAKVFSNHASVPAYTIHKVIYRQKKANDPGAGFSLNYNKYSHTLFIVDEASMISNQGSEHPFFGSGHLLDDLLSFVYSKPGCRLLFVGDTAQLPPVGEEDGPALMASEISAPHFKVTSCELTEGMRQAHESGILHNATRLRHCLADGCGLDEIPTIRFSGFQDLRSISGSELIEALEESYDHCGTEQTIVITRSNKRANAYNQGVRSAIFGRDGGLSQVDIIMGVKNNYYWVEMEQARAGKDCQLPMDFIANGDIAVVKRIHRFQDFYNLHFADVTLSFPDYDDFEISLRVILDALQSESAALSPEQSNQLYEGVLSDYSEYPTKAKRMEQLRKDPNYNALQIKYAYAVTCHKAQGGQWEHVFIDQGWMPEGSVDHQYYRWLYTAFTRAQQQLNLINWPKDKQA